MTYKYTICIIVDENWDEAESFTTTNPNEMLEFLMKNNNDYCLNKRGLKLDTDFKNPIHTSKITSYKKGSEKEIDYIEYLMYIQVNKK